MKARKLTVAVLTTVFMIGSGGMTYAQTGTRDTSTTAKTQSKGKVDCPGKSEQSQGKAKQHNPNCRPVR